jgi:CBS domain-containing protein
MRTKVREVMTDRPRAVTPDTPVSEAARLMESEDVGALPILEGEQLAGIVTDRDIVVRAVAKEKDPKGMPVRDVASKNIVAIGPDDSLSDALEAMASAQVRRIPVIDDGNRLIGMISQADVAREAKAKDVGELVEEISEPQSGPRV